MKKSIYFFLIFISLLSCNNNKNISKTEVDYKNKKDLLQNYCNNYFDKVENDKISLEEQQYLKFLFAYMPLSDFAEYDYNFYLQIVKKSIEARESFHWAKTVPIDIFETYVLPPRINNENIDSTRILLFEELKSRFGNKKYSLEEAALEINHWCHEKVNYQPTDERTIGPLGVIKRTFGRCGEESTFLTNALRCVGIPARQVYTPRWAHTDDNHAWVEVWINGTWKYMGACEPSPMLNRGWFDVPATRTMLVFAKEFGVKTLNINNNFLFATDNYIAVNSITNYAPVKKIEVLVVDSNNNPIKGVSVQFQLYNYAEMYPILSQNTDDKGKVFFQTGIGALDLYVSNEKYFIVKTIQPEEKGLIKITLDKNIYPAERVKYKVPIAGKPKHNDEKLEKENNIRLAKEDSIREKYIEQFYTKTKGEEFCKKYNYSNEVANFLVDSRGNYEEISKFLIKSAEKKQQAEATKLLSVIATKDLCDNYSQIFEEHLQYAYSVKNNEIPNEIFEKYVLNPRISFEMLKKYRKKISEEYHNFNYNSDINELKNEILKKISTKIKGKEVNDINSYGVIITPNGVNKIKLANERSLKIYFIAVCRTIGIPAQLELSTGFIRVYQQGEWKDIFLNNESTKNTEIKRATIYMKSAIENRELKYRINFALAKLSDDNVFKTVDLDWEIPINNFNDGIKLPIGEYMLLSSSRMENGDIIVERKYFTLKESKDTTLFVTVPVFEIDSTEKKSFHFNEIFENANKKIDIENILKEKEYTAICWINPSTEPSKHIMRDLTPMIEELQKNNINTIFLHNVLEFNPEKYAFSKKMKYYLDKDFSLLNKNLSNNEKEDKIQTEFPIMLLVDKNNKIIFSSNGYIIGIGELLLNKIE